MSASRLEETELSETILLDEIAYFENRLNQLTGSADPKNQGMSKVYETLLNHRKRLLQQVQIGTMNSWEPN